MKKRLLLPALILVLALGLTGLTGCGKKAETPAPTPGTEAPAKGIDASKAIIDASNEYFKSSPTPTISADDLYNLVQAKDAGYQLVDIRSAEHYALGHVDGAINIPFKTVADDASLTQLDPDKKIVVICYTGHTASMANMIWNAMGYDALSLKFGMTGWSNDKAIVGLDIPAKVGATSRPTVTTASEASGPFDPPAIDGDFADAKAAVQAQAQAWFAKDLPPTIVAGDVFNVVQSKDPGYQIISVRGAEDYAKGHIEGAINIPWTEIADKVSQIDPSKKIIVYCYTGHTGGEAAMFLNLMGYDAYNMKFGMSDWNSDPAMGGNPGYDPATVKNLPTVK